MKYQCFAAFVAVGVASATAAAGSFDGWNLVVGGDLTLSTSEVDGSALIGGSLLGGTSNYAVQMVTDPAGTGLAVGNLLDSDVTVNINNGGDFQIGSFANQLGTVNLNGGGSSSQNPGISALAASILSQAKATSGDLAGLMTTGTIDGAGNMNSAATLPLDGFNVAVYELAQAQFDSGLGQLNLNFGAADTVIINYTSASGIADLTAPPNLIGGFNQANSNRILWNFIDVSQITSNNTFNGAMLAPNAALNLVGGGINGSVIVDSIQSQNAEIRLKLYDGYLPAPGAAALFVAAGVGIGARRRSRIPSVG